MKIFKWIESTFCVILKKTLDLSRNCSYRVDWLMGFLVVLGSSGLPLDLPKIGNLIDFWGLKGFFWGLLYGIRIILLVSWDPGRILPQDPPKNSLIPFQPKPFNSLTKNTKFTFQPTNPTIKITPKHQIQQFSMKFLKNEFSKFDYSFFSIVFLEHSDFVEFTCQLIFRIVCLEWKWWEIC